MDFVQRNLINERNNLQVELAKAKILIAQLSEEKKIVGERPKKGPHVREQKPKIYVQGKDGNYEPQSIPTKQQNTSPAGPESTNEQAQYISSLENAVIALAESMNMSAEDLLNEVRAVSDDELTTPSGIARNAININRVRGVMDRLHNRTQAPGYHNAVGTAKDAYDSERGSHMLTALGLKTRVRTSGVGVAVASDHRPNDAGEVFNKDTTVLMGSNNQSDRAVGALRANNMSSNRANRPAGPVADTTQRSVVGKMFTTAAATPYGRVNVRLPGSL